MITCTCTCTWTWGFRPVCKYGPRLTQATFLMFRPTRRRFCHFFSFRSRNKITKIQRLRFCMLVKALTYSLIVDCFLKLLKRKIHHGILFYFIQIYIYILDWKPKCLKLCKFLLQELSGENKASDTEKYSKFIFRMMCWFINTFHLGFINLLLNRVYLFFNHL